MQNEFTNSGIRLSFLPDFQSQRIGMRLMPEQMAGDVVSPREYLSGLEVDNLPEAWGKLPADKLESLVQLHLRGDRHAPAFGGGLTMRGSGSVDALVFQDQKVVEENGTTRIRMRFSHPSGLELIQCIEFVEGSPCLRAWTEACNKGSEPVVMEMLSSFCLQGMTPFHAADAPNRLFLHRFQSTWSREGQHEEALLEELGLDRSWAGYGVRNLRFGQVGSMPVRGYFPMVILEDRDAGMCWGAHLDAPASWQMEVYRRGDTVSISGGLADREFGHWWKTLQVGEKLVTPAATLTAIEGKFEDACHALTSALEDAAVEQTSMEAGLPHIFNEWSSTWGFPREDYVLETADRLKETHSRYLIIDDGWAERPKNGIQSNGDWNVNCDMFPDGLKATCDKIRERGLIPGIWFEFEVCTEGTKAYQQAAYHLHRDGVPLQVGTRRFWDFRNPWVHDYLRKKVIGLIRECGIGYLKVDYNDTIGIGCDPAVEGDGPGEGLRQHIEGVQQFFREIRETFPELVFENCSSGGHRSEPSFMRLTSMTSFSDAHESLEIPIIAANLHRLMLPRQIQIWSVLHESDTLQRTRYLLSATFLGRMCISGAFKELSDEQIAEVNLAQAFHESIAPVILSGKSLVIRKTGPSYRYPTGWQAVVRQATSAEKLLVVLHSFGQCPESVEIDLPCTRQWKIKDLYGSVDSANLSIDGNRLRIKGLADFCGAGIFFDNPGR